MPGRANDPKMMRKAKGGAMHGDAAMDAAMVKKMVKPSAMKPPVKKAAGGAMGVRKGMSGKKMSDCI